jgi:peptidoglycan biosynthesis protein MviN/MurJ (putative lipid II flippase)
MRGFYSAGVTKKPFIINLFSTVLLFILAWGSVEFFYTSENFRYFVSSLLKVEDLPNTAVLMLPLAFTIAMGANGILHWLAFERQFPGFNQKVFRTLFHCIGSATVMGAVAYLGLHIFDGVLNTSSLVGIFLQGALAGLLGVLAGLLVLYFLKNQELMDVIRAFKAKFWRNKVIATDQEIV